MAQLESSITQILRANAEWGDVIRACVEWSVEEREAGKSGQFTRETVYYRLGRSSGEGPKLTPLVRAGIIKRAWTNSRGQPYYELAQSPSDILSALSRAWAKEGSRTD